MVRLNLSRRAISLSALSEAKKARGAGSTAHHNAPLPFSLSSMFDPMADLNSPASSEDPLAPSYHYSDGAPAPQQGGHQGGGHRGGGGGGDSGRYGEELHSVTIRARQRTFYVDLKQSRNGKFLKVSEKSRGGQKTTIIFDVEDLPQFIAALQEMQAKV